MDIYIAVGFLLLLALSFLLVIYRLVWPRPCVVAEAWVVSVRGREEGLMYQAFAELTHRCRLVTGIYKKPKAARNKLERAALRCGVGLRWREATDNG